MPILRTLLFAAAKHVATNPRLRAAALKGAQTALRNAPKPEQVGHAAGRGVRRVLDTVSTLSDRKPKA